MRNLVQFLNNPLAFRSNLVLHCCLHNGIQSKYYTAIFQFDSLWTKRLQSTWIAVAVRCEINVISYRIRTWSTSRQAFKFFGTNFSVFRLNACISLNFMLFLIGKLRGSWLFLNDSGIPLILGGVMEKVFSLIWSTHMTSMQTYRNNNGSNTRVLRPRVNRANFAHDNRNICDLSKCVWFGPINTKLISIVIFSG